MARSGEKGALRDMSEHKMNQRCTLMGQIFDNLHYFGAYIEAAYT
jgi:hypothetical protein